jgi:hypothetical protein
MYRRHFGLQESPFGITPNPAFFYTDNTRGLLAIGVMARRYLTFLA